MESSFVRYLGLKLTIIRFNLVHSSSHPGSAYPSVGTFGSKYDSECPICDRALIGRLPELIRALMFLALSEPIFQSTTMLTISLNDFTTQHYRFGSLTGLSHDQYLRRIQCFCSHAATLPRIITSLQNIRLTLAQASASSSILPRQLQELNPVSLTPEEASFFDFSNPNKTSKCRRCKVFPGDPKWPSVHQWALLNKTTNGALIKTIPIGAPCFPGSLVRCR